MKRYIRSQTINAWYVGEPSDYDPKTKRSYYSNPKDWKDKLAEVEHVLEPYESHLALGSRSPWGCEIVQRAPKGQHWPRVYYFDYWEDNMPFGQQIAEFTDIAEGIVNPTQH